MDDLVGRITRELPDTDRNRYDIAYERGRAQARSSLLFGGIALGTLIGGAAMYLLDPAHGHGRRIELGQRLGALARTISGTIGGRTTQIGHRAMGAASGLGLPGAPAQDASDPSPGADLAFPAPRSAGAHLEVTERIEDLPVVVEPEPVAVAGSR